MKCLQYQHSVPSSPIPRQQPKAEGPRTTEAASEGSRVRRGSSSAASSWKAANSEARDSTAGRIRQAGSEGQVVRQQADGCLGIVGASTGLQVGTGTAAGSHSV